MTSEKQKNKIKNLRKYKFSSFNEYGTNENK